jgi:hypothetical protein
VLKNMVLPSGSFISIHPGGSADGATCGCWLEAILAIAGGYVFMSALAVSEGPFIFGVATAGRGSVGLTPFGAGRWYTEGEVEAMVEVGSMAGQ